MASSIDEIRQHIRIYLGVFLALMGLTIVTVSVAQVHLAIPLAVSVALAIALVKGSLVASFFMHLINERRAIFAALLLTVVFFLALIFLPLLGHVDQVRVVR